MARYHQVLWSEGLFVTQHHFQQRDRYFDKDIGFRARSTVLFSYGVSLLGIDTDAIANKMFTLQEFEGMLPDGTTVRVPRVDDPPPTRSLEEAFPPTESVLGVYLGLPVDRPGLPTVRMGGEGRAVQTRYSREFTTVPDLVTGEGEREIAYAKKELCLLFSDDDLNEYDCLKIAEVIRNPEGVMELKKTFVPTALAIGSSAYLKNWVKGLLEVCSAKSDSLSDQLRQRTPQLADLTAQEIPNFLFLHTLSTAIPILTHFHSHPQSHPVDVFSAASRLAGALCAFYVERHPRELPVYDHNNLGDCFADLDSKLRELLDLGTVRRYIPIPLTQKETTLFEGTIPIPELVESGQFYLGVRSEIPETQLIKEFPVHGKVISPDKMKALIERNLPGVGLVYTAHPPAALPIKAAMVYFRMENTGDRWEFIRQANAVAVYGPPASFPGLMVELMAIEG